MRFLPLWRCRWQPWNGVGQLRSASCTSGPRQYGRGGMAGKKLQQLATLVQGFLYNESPTGLRAITFYCPEAVDPILQATSYYSSSFPLRPSIIGPSSLIDK